MDFKREVNFVVYDLSTVGGKEKKVIELANLLSFQNYKVRMLTLNCTDFPMIPINDKIEILAMGWQYHQFDSNWGKKLISYLKFQLALLRFFTKHKIKDFVISTDYFLTILLFLPGLILNFRLIAWEHSTYVMLNNILWKNLRRCIYPILYKVVLLNQTEREYYGTKNCIVITNPFLLRSNEFDLESCIVERYNKREVLWIGRLTYEKDPLYLISLGAQLRDKDIRIKVFGEGILRDQLRESINQNRLEGVILLNDFTDDVLTASHNSSLLLMTSLFDCFPSVIVELMSIGIATVAFDCPTGPKHIIQDGVNGFLINLDDKDKTAGCIVNVLDDFALYHNLSSNSKGMFINYDNSTVLSHWKKILL
jgi:amylovoran biosynthesis glycosyltransferase AmsD